MDSNFEFVPQSYYQTGMAPLDAKAQVQVLTDLTNFGPSNNKAFTYYRGMQVYCHETKKRYEWTDEFPEGATKLLPTDFTYPNGTTYDGEDYSNLSFNFIEASIQGIQGPAGPAGPQGAAGTPGADGQDGQDGADAIVLAPNNLPVQHAIIPFNRAQVLTNGGKLIHNLNVQRYLTEHFSYSNELFNQNDVSVLTPKEMIEKSVISGYNYLNPNEIELIDFVNYKPVINNNDMVWYVVSYIGDAIPASIYIPNKTLNLNYDHTVTPPSESTYFFTMGTLLSGMVNTGGAPITTIKIKSLAGMTNADLAVNGFACTNGQLIPEANITAEEFRIWLDQISGTGSGNYQCSFVYSVFDSNGIESNDVTFTINATDTYFVYTMDNPIAKTVNYNSTDLPGTLSFAFTFAELCQNIFNSLSNDTVAIKVYMLPNRGSITDQGFDVSVNYLINKSQLDLGYVEFWPLGSDGLQPSGSYTTSFSFRGVDTDGNESNLVYCKLNVVNSVVATVTAELQWEDTGTTEARTGPEGLKNVILYYAGSVLPGGETEATVTMQRNTVSGFVDLFTLVGTTNSLDSFVGLNQYRIKVVGSLGTIVYSNTIQYTGDGTGTGDVSGSGSGGSGSGGGSGPSSGQSGDPSDASDGGSDGGFEGSGE